MERAARVRVAMTAALEEFAAAVEAGRPACPSAGDILEVHRLLDQFYRVAGTVE